MLRHQFYYSDSMLRCKDNSKKVFRKNDDDKKQRSLYGMCVNMQRHKMPQAGFIKGIMGTYFPFAEF